MIEQHHAPLSFLDKPQLPPLGDGSKFIPLDPITSVKPAEDVRLVIRLKDRRVYVYRQNDIQTSFPIAVGKAGWETPKGTFKVIQKIKNPIWEHPWTGELVPSGPDNPLGSRWIGFWTDGKNVIGFHGTPNEESVGRAASHGCVRMFDKDVQVLFEKVDVGTPVIVEP
jgi:lipoprotein-anchoring transpeptidase ErfK/SrfK